MDNTTKDLYYLDELPDYKVADGDEDIRGWEVKDMSNELIGKVDGLMVSKAAKKVVYIDVQLDLEDTKSDAATTGEKNEKEDHVLIPVGLAELNDDEKQVHCKSIELAVILQAKRFARGTAIDKAYEEVLYSHYSRKNKEQMATQGNFYDREYFSRQ